MGTPYKMKGSPMARNFGVGSPLRQDKMKASQTKINAKTGVTTVDENPGSKGKSKTETLMHKRPKNSDGTPYTDKQMLELRKKSFEKDMNKMPGTSKGSFSNAKTTKF